MRREVKLEVRLQVLCESQVNYRTGRFRSILIPGIDEHGDGSASDITEVQDTLDGKRGGIRGCGIHRCRHDTCIVMECGAIHHTWVAAEEYGMP